MEYWNSEDTIVESMPGGGGESASALCHFDSRTAHPDPCCRVLQRVPLDHQRLAAILLFKHVDAIKAAAAENQE